MLSFGAPKNKKVNMLLIAGVGVVIVGVLVYFLAVNVFKKSDNVVVDQTGNSTQYAAPTAEELQAQSEQKDAIIQGADKTTANEPKTSSSLAASITRATQAGPGQPLNIRVEVVGANQGTCEVALTKSGQPTVFKTFNVTFEATSSRCDGADIEASEFSEGGDWRLSLVIKSGGLQSEPVTQMVSIAK